MRQVVLVPLMLLGLGLGMSGRLEAQVDKVFAMSLPGERYWCKVPNRDASMVAIGLQERIVIQDAAGQTLRWFGTALTGSRVLAWDPNGTTLYSGGAGTMSPLWRRWSGEPEVQAWNSTNGALLWQLDRRIDAGMVKRHGLMEIEEHYVRHETVKLIVPGSNGLDLAVVLASGPVLLIDARTGKIRDLLRFYPAPHSNQEAEEQFQWAPATAAFDLSGTFLWALCRRSGAGQGFHLAIHDLVRGETRWFKPAAPLDDPVLCGFSGDQQTFYITLGNGTSLSLDRNALPADGVANPESQAVTMGEAGDLATILSRADGLLASRILERQGNMGPMNERLLPVPSLRASAVAFAGKGSKGEEILYVADSVHGQIFRVDDFTGSASIRALDKFKFHGLRDVWVRQLVPEAPGTILALVESDVYALDAMNGAELRAVNDFGAQYWSASVIGGILPDGGRLLGGNSGLVKLLGNGRLADRIGSTVSGIIEGQGTWAYLDEGNSAYAGFVEHGGKSLVYRGYRRHEYGKSLARYVPFKGSGGLEQVLVFDMPSEPGMQGNLFVWQPGSTKPWPRDTHGQKDGKILYPLSKIPARVQILGWNGARNKLAWAEWDDDHTLTVKSLDPVRRTIASTIIGSAVPGQLDMSPDGRFIAVASGWSGLVQESLQVYSPMDKQSFFD